MRFFNLFDMIALEFILIYVEFYCNIKEIKNKMYSIIFIDML